MIRTNLGAATAYAEAVKQGYSGTREQFGKDQASFAENAQQVAADRTAVEAERKAAEALIPEIEEKKSAAVKAVEEKGAATLASIPEDYSTLAARVDTHDVNKVAVDRGNLWNGESESGYITSAGKVAEHNLTEYTKPIYLYPGTYLYRRYTNMFGSNAGNVFLTDETGAVKSVIAEAGMDETLDVSMITLEKGHYCFNISKGSGAAQQMIIAGDSYEDWPDEQRAYGDVRIEEGVGFNDGMRAQIDAQVSAIVDGAIVFAFDDIEIGEIIATYVSIGGTQLTGAYHCEIAARAGEQYQFKCRTGSAVTQAVLLSEDRSAVLGVCGTTGETWNTLHEFDTTFIVPADGVLCVNDIYGDILAVRKLVYRAATDADVAGKVAVQVSKEVIRSLNLWNGEYVQGGFAAAGAIHEGAEYAYTAPIHLSAGTYLFKRYWAVYGTNAGEALRVSGTGAFIRSLKETSCDETLDVSLITLEEGKYCFNLGNSETRRNAFMLIAGESFDDWPDAYQVVGEEVQIEPGVKLNDAMREEVTAMTQANPLYGKTIAFEGDSICYGAGSTGGYAKTISERNAMVCYNTAVSGGVMPSGILTSSGSERHSIAAGVAAMNPDADYLIFEGGVNDTSLDLTLGEIAEGYPVQGDSDTLDASTFLGAFEFACRELVTTFAGKKVGYIFVHGIFASDHRWNTLWRSKMKEILVKWGVPYLDLQEQTPPLNLIPALKATYTANGDGWHPNELGYTKFYCDKIEAWLKTL